MIKETNCPGNRLNDFVLILEKDKFRGAYTPELIRASYNISRIKSEISRKKRIRLTGDILSNEGLEELSNKQKNAIEFYLWSNMKRFYHKELDAARSEIFYGLRRHVLRCNEKTPCLERYDNFLEHEAESYIAELKGGLSLSEIEELKGPEAYDKIKSLMDLKHLCVSLID